MSDGVTDFVEVVAKVESVFLGREDHGVFTMMLHVSYGTGGQGIGGYCFDGYDQETKQRTGSAFGIEWIAGVLDACGVDEVSKIAGRTIYVLKQDESWGAKVVGIKPLPTEKGKPFIFDELSQKHFPATRGNQ